MILVRAQRAEIKQPEFQFLPFAEDVILNISQIKFM